MNPKYSFTFRYLLDFCLEFVWCVQFGFFFQLRCLNDIVWFNSTIFRGSKIQKYKCKMPKPNSSYVFIVTHLDKGFPSHAILKTLNNNKKNSIILFQTSALLSQQQNSLRQSAG